MNNFENINTQLLVRPTDSEKQAIPIRLAHLDGLRGWASLSVFLFHATWEFFGVLQPAWRNPLTGALFNGQMSVAVFFILSGESLSVPYWAKDNSRFVFRQIIKRYPRLTIPVFSSCLIVYFLMTWGFVYNERAAALVQRQEWMGHFLTFNADFIKFLHYSLWGVYTNAKDADIYNPLLWTMNTEMEGSLVVFVILLCCRYFYISNVFLALLAVPFFFQKSFVSCFLFGMIFARWHVSGRFTRWRAKPWVRRGALALFIISLIYVSIRQSQGNSSVRPYTIASILFVLATHCHTSIVEFLGNRASAWLGRISFPLYLIQFPIFVSFTSAATIALQARGMLNAWTINAIIVVTIILTLVCAWAFTGIETLTHRVCNRLGRLV